MGKCLAGQYSFSHLQLQLLLPTSVISVALIYHHIHYRGTAWKTEHPQVLLKTDELAWQDNGVHTRP